MTKKRRKPRNLSRALGQTIEHLPGFERIDAIALEMWGPPAKPKTPTAFGHPVSALNHTYRLAQHFNISQRWLRTLRRRGSLPPELLDRITSEWRLWRRRQGELLRTNRKRARQAATRAKLQAIKERGIEAVRDQVGR